MKKIVVILVVICCFFFNTKAQGVKKIIGGVIFASCGTTNFSNIEKPFDFGSNLLPNICFITDKTYHNVVYGMANNSTKVVNGYPFGKKDLDVYFAPGIGLSSGIFLMALGIEKMIKAENVNFFMFAEIGKDFKSGLKPTLSIGFHVNIQAVLYEKKGK